MTASVVVVAAVGGDAKVSSEMELLRQLLLLLEGAESVVCTYPPPYFERFCGEMRNNSNENTLQRIYYQLK